MIKFNAKQFEDSLSLTCKNCGFVANYKIASKGCPTCGFYFFKVADRTGTPTSWVRDNKDPYLRQKQTPMGNNDGAGQRLTTPADEETGGGFGTRFRGGLAPKDFSESSDEYRDQLKNDIPSETTLMDQPPSDGTPSLGWFADPQDALSSTQMMNRTMEGHDTNPFDKQLAKSRNNRTDRRRLDDSIFGRTVSKLRGVQR